LTLSEIFLRDNPYIRHQQNKDQSFPRGSIYKTTISLSGNSCIVDSSGAVLIRLLSGIVPEHLLDILEQSASKHQQQVSKQSMVNDIRGQHACVTFGSYVERGGSGKIWTVKDHPSCRGFLEEIHAVGQFVSDLFSKVCVEVASDVAYVPEEYKLWAAVSLLFWNASNISKSHVDVRDLQWSLVLPFGDFTGGEIDLPYLNAIVKARRGDIYLINSNKVFHKVNESGPNRQALVFTNHRSVVQRFCNIQLSNLFTQPINN
jgi:hypothetical protein